MNKRYIIMILVALISSCKEQKVDKGAKDSPIVGSWELISATTIQGDSTFHKDLSNSRMIKLINDSHFAFLNHDLNGGKDSLKAFVAGGGTYELINDKYIEFLEYCNYRQWENNKFEFNVAFKGDTLIQNGIEEVPELGVDRRIIEVYIRTTK